MTEVLSEDVLATSEKRVRDADGCVQAMPEPLRRHAGEIVDSGLDRLRRLGSPRARRAPICLTRGALVACARESGGSGRAAA